MAHRMTGSAPNYGTLYRATLRHQEDGVFLLPNVNPIPP